MSESGKIKANSGQVSRPTSERIVNVNGRSVRIISKKEADAKIDKFTAPKRGVAKDYDAPNGYRFHVLHRGVNGRRNEFFGTAYKNGKELGGGYYAQYVTDGSYPGRYSVVSSSKEEAFDNIKSWMKSHIR